LPQSLLVSFSGSAAAFDCLSYKPEGARGQWHAEVVAGKICWFGANWRSFLPKKARTEGSALPNKRPADPKVISEQPAEPTPAPAKAMEVKDPGDSSGLRQATPTEAAALINAVSLEFEPPPPAVPDPPDATVVAEGITELIVIFGVLAISAFVLATLIYKRGKRHTVEQLISETDGTEQELVQSVPTSSAPPLQPSAVNEHQLTNVPSWLVRARAETLNG
jgi:hypothetical protein